MPRGERSEPVLLLVRRRELCAAVCLAGCLACVGSTEPLSVSAPETGGAMNAGGAPGTGGLAGSRSITGTGGAKTAGGGAGGQGGGITGTGTCGTACPSGQTCDAGKCAVCGGFVMPNPVAATLPNPASYDTSVAGVVTDAVTGLTWEQIAAPGTYDLPTAASYCKNNQTGGLSGWRLPTVTELVSLLDFTVPSPGATIDGATFPGTAGDKFWTSTPYLNPGNDPSANAFVVDFEYGGTDSSLVTGDDVAVRIRCVVPSAVRGPRCYPPPRFIVAGTGTSATVTDNSTKLVWQRSSSASTMTWDAAKTYCSRASLRSAEHEGATNHRRLHGSGTRGSDRYGRLPQDAGRLLLDVFAGCRQPRQGMDRQLQQRRYLPHSEWRQVAGSLCAMTVDDQRKGPIRVFALTPRQRDPCLRAPTTTGRTRRRVVSAYQPAHQHARRDRLRRGQWALETPARRTFLPRTGRDPDIMNEPYDR